MIAPVSGKKYWFKTWWGITILIVLYLLIIAALAFAFLIFNYWRMIRSGQGAFLQQQFYSQHIKPVQEDPAVIAARKVLETADDPYLGNPDASLVIVEFMDFKCPICRAQAPVLQQLAAKYGFKIKVIIRDFPMESVYPGTQQLSAIASCAHEQGAYWFFADYFFANQDALPAAISSETIDNLSEEAGMDKSKMRNCLEIGNGKTEVSKDYSDAYKSGVSRGTPTFFVNGQKLEGMVPLESWEKLFKDINIAI